LSGGIFAGLSRIAVRIGESELRIGKLAMHHAGNGSGFRRKESAEKGDWGWRGRKGKVVAAESQRLRIVRYGRHEEA